MPEAKDQQSDHQNDDQADPKEIGPGDFGKIEPRALETEMQESYLDYAMSVIVARALPDVRDGLKPVHRRVLYSMHELGLTSRAKYRKSATVVGDVLGKYHPHGDIAVYDTLVRMAQSFSMRYPLVDGQGNFGSMDGDSPAAMRYTEVRMTSTAEEMLADIEKNTVNFVPNYDGSREEPVVLPARLPQLLLNGSLGIAVGMATNIPPHNLTELCDGLIALIDNPDATVDELMEYVKGPDFPTGGNIYNIEDIKMAYATGRGKIVIRAVANIEETKRGFRIIVSEIPYQVNKADLIAKIAELVKEKKIEGVSDLRDESDRKEGVRIIIELKSSAYPKKVLNKLFEHTNMQTAFHVNMLALVDSIQPRVLTLKNILEEFIKHRQEVVRRRTQFELNRAKERAHILEGLKKALDHIDEIISTIKKSETKEIAHKNLMTRFALTDKQATAILEMKLSALAGLERKKLEDELEEKLKLIEDLSTILASAKKILEIVKREIIDIKEKFGDERKTKIYKQKIGEFSAEDLIPNEQVFVTLTRGNYVKRVPAATFKSQGRGGKGVIGMETKEEDVVDHMLTCWTHDDIMFFTNRGRVFTTKVYDLPSVGRTAKGLAIVNIIQIGPDEKVTAILAINKDNHDKYFFMTTKKGVAKKTEISAYQNVRKTGLIAIKLNSDDELKWVVATSGADNIIIVSRTGQGIYFNEQDVRPMGRSAAGVRGIRLREADDVIAMNVIKNDQADLLTVSEKGLGKRTKISNFSIQRRGGYGMRAARISDRTGKIVEAMVIIGDAGDIIFVSKSAQVIRMPLRSVKRLGRDTQGVTLMRFSKNDTVSSMALIRQEDNISSNKAESGKDKKTDDKEQEARKEQPAMASRAGSLKPTQAIKTERSKGKSGIGLAKSFKGARNKKSRLSNKKPKKVKKSASPRAKTFKPFIRARQKSRKVIKSEITKPKVRIKHYQAGRRKDEPNYWGAQ